MSKRKLWEEGEETCIDPGGKHVGWEFFVLPRYLQRPSRERRRGVVDSLREFGFAQTYDV